MANRLAKEKSPYLLQHAHNPVDWYPWSDEAFEMAAAEDKPVFLSIGYSTCHWCHVMERESFEDDEVARQLNAAFVCIKVDREERPDIDNIYMTVCSMMTGSGGWPLTIVMTPDKKPFFAGTYFAKHSQYGRLGMLDMIPRLHDIWSTRRDEVLQSADKILEIVKQQNQSTPGRSLDQKILQEAFNGLSERFDPVYGGFSKKPKFPTPHNITFLLRYWKTTGNDQALTMAEQTLTAMRYGGIFDQIGFGFHRYSTDEKWLLPHFEKMLYDQALLAVAYLEAFQATANPLFRQTAREIFSYVLRDMTGPEYGFYSAEDADSEGIEGKFYVWSADELSQVLSAEEVELVKKLYNIKPGGNFQDEATGAQTSVNIFHLGNPLDINTPATRKKSDDFTASHEQIRQKLFASREKRIHPHKDDKILVDWNGLMIGALARGARILDDKAYLASATKAANFILTTLRLDNSLKHRYRDGEWAIAGMLCDYAYVVWGLLELYAAGFDSHILADAILLNQQMLNLFWDERNGGFFLTPKDGEAQIVRPKEIYDGALPSGNSIALENLVRLERLTGNPDLGAKARILVEAFSDTILELPSAYTQFLANLNLSLSPTVEVVVVGDSHAADTQAMLAILQQKFLPNIFVMLKDTTANAQKLAEIAPHTADLAPINDRATAYVCQDFKCERPITEVAHLISLLATL